MTQTSIENLFQSIDTIVNARIANLPFDQTLECEIIKVDEKEKNKYLIKYQASTFSAYSQNNVVYEPGDIVYVQIPQGDFTQDKFILSKRSVIDQSSTKKMPFLSFVKNANLFNASISSREYSIQTSSDEKEGSTVTKPVKIFYGERFGAGYTQIGVKFAVKADITEQLISGKYGARLVLQGYDQSKTYLSAEIASVQGISPVFETRYFDFPMDEMVGSSVYNTLGYNNQEKVFDITNFVITSASLQFYQDGDFYVKGTTESLASQYKELINQRDAYERQLTQLKNLFKENSTTSTEDIPDITEEQIRHMKDIIEMIDKKIAVSAIPAKKYKIYFTNLQLFLGYNSSEFINSNFKTFLYTPDGLYYNNEWYNKNLKVRYIEVIDKTNLNVLDSTIAGSSSYQIYWEKYNSTETKISQYSNLQSYVLLNDINGIDVTYSLATQRGVLTQTFVATVRNIGIGKSYVSNKLLFISSAYLTESELLDVLSNKEYFVIDRNGYVFLNGGTNGGTANGGVTISKGYITDSTLNNVKLTGTNTGTIQYAKNYTTDGNIYANLQKIKQAIEALGGNYTIQ